MAIVNGSNIKSQVDGVGPIIIHHLQHWTKRSVVWKSIDILTLLLLDQTLSVVEHQIIWFLERKHLALGSLVDHDYVKCLNLGKEWWNEHLKNMYVEGRFEMNMRNN
jgi:hypothetical protein